MAEPFVRFSCLLHVGSPANAARALDAYVALSEDDTRDVSLSQAFRLSIEPDHGPSILWIRDDDGGDPDGVIRFALHCARLFGLGGLWGFSYAIVADRSEPEAMGGRAHLLDLGAGRVLASVDATTWLAERIDAGADHA
ncbi:hypothetical protein BJF93_23245 [Xaviernesmea oryzae]|uniref:Uncharacterized protein n=1 Tax=Xaviernesmea oryzae TaxID=464029 RepID=A0A1Q9AU68_9HYPH|nr:hypothetical protein [Xaviernesmea oryzae]OLP58966.1 hypothetical protein BJF93_23245 [Xaviernesmea oryzae]SEM01099.1 hypothetical protein SAMN04487976_11717 [Xaviernesmea oryzae]